MQNNENNVNASCNGNSVISKATSRAETKKFTPVMKKADLNSLKDGEQTDWHAVNRVCILC